MRSKNAELLLARKLLGSSKMLSDDYFRKGFQVFDDAELANSIPLDIISWEYESGPNSDKVPIVKEPLFLEAVLYNIHEQIGIKYVSKYSYELDRRRLWDGVNSDATQWHNDKKWEDQNNRKVTCDCVFLMYHTTIPDGAVCFKNNDGITEILPRAGLLIAVNNERFDCLHRGTPSEHARIISTYGFKVKHNYNYNVEDYV